MMLLDFVYKQWDFNKTFGYLFLQFIYNENKINYYDFG